MPGRTGKNRANLQLPLPLRLPENFRQEGASSARKQALHEIARGFSIGNVQCREQNAFNEPEVAVSERGQGGGTFRKESAWTDKA